MSLEKGRIISLIDFCRESARLRGKVVASVEGHREFRFFEHEVQGLPGMRLNPDPTSDDEIWLRIERLRESRPPELRNPVVRPWVRMTQSPTDAPQLTSAATGAALIVAGTHCAPPGDGFKPMVAADEIVQLPEYGDEGLIRASFAAYVDTKWRPWAEDEKRKRRTIRIYSELFTLQQQIEGAIVESPLESVWESASESGIQNGPPSHIR